MTINPVRVIDVVTGVALIGIGIAATRVNEGEEYLIAAAIAVLFVCGVVHAVEIYGPQILEGLYGNKENNDTEEDGGR